jgi:hypothetical protein
MMRSLALLGSVLSLTGCELAYPTHEAPEGDAAVDSTIVITGSCKPPGLYCGNDKVHGDPGILYKCVADADAVISERCETGCIVAPPGSDDFCQR